jgi:ribonucleotide monophosphatase NagD (HAD superfamily)
MGRDALLMVVHNFLLMEKILGFLLDISGTLLVNQRLVPGVVEALDACRQRGIPVRLCSNTTKESRARLVERLNALGCGVDKQHVFTSLTAAAQLVDKLQLRPFLMLEEEAKNEFRPVEDNVYTAVVVGLSPSTLNYTHVATFLHFDGGR